MTWGALMLRSILITSSRPQSATKYWNSLGSFWIFETPMDYPSVHMFSETPKYPIVGHISHWYPSYPMVLGEIPLLRSWTSAFTFPAPSWHTLASASTRRRRCFGPWTPWNSTVYAFWRWRDAGDVERCDCCWRLHPRNYWEFIWELKKRQAKYGNRME